MKKLSSNQLTQLKYDWSFWAREEQFDPRFRENDPRDYMWWILLAGRGFGKDLAKNTPIISINGYKNIGDLKVGDEIFAHDGSVTKVTGLYHPPKRQLVEFTFSDGEKIVSSIEHEWVTWTHAERKAYLRSPYEDSTKFPENWPQWRLKRLCGFGMYLSEDTVNRAIQMHASGMSLRAIERSGLASRTALSSHIKAGCYISPEAIVYEDSPGPQIRTTQEIIDTFRYGKRGDLNHCIPTCGALKFPEKNLLVDPYLLGLWLGDGSTGCGTIAAHEDDQDFFKNEFNSRGIKTTKRKQENVFGTIGLHKGLREIGVLKNKRIPSEYLYSSVDQRLELLRGLMDTDGFCHKKNGYVEFCNTNRNIIDGLVFLARSLGQKPKVIEKNPCSGEYKTAWRVTWRPHTYNPFKIPRKADLIHENGNQSLRNYHRMIVDWRYVDHVETVCIEVDHPDHLFLAGEGLIPTHNTRTGAEWVRQQVLQGKREIAIIGPSAREVRKVQVEGESGILRCCPSWDMPVYHKSSTIQTLEWENGAKAHLLTAENPDRIRGYNFDAAWLDELAAWEENQFQDTIDQLMFALRGTAGDGKPRVCVTTTPKPHLPFVKFYNDKKSDTDNVVVTSGSTFANAANLSENALDAMRAAYFDDEGNPTYLAKQELFGFVIEDMDKRLWTEDIIEAAQHRYEKFNYKTELDKIVVSVDPSGLKTGDEVGIVVFGIRREEVTLINKETREPVIKKLPVGYLLEDASGQYGPQEWAQKACMLYNRYNANYVIGETNYGGDMVREVIKSYDPKVIFKKAHATRGKEIRAMPVASLYEAHRIKHWVFDEYKNSVDRNKYIAMERQMLKMTYGGYVGDGSPDRLDALVWAVNDTMLKGMVSAGVTDIMMSSANTSLH